MKLGAKAEATAPKIMITATRDVDLLASDHVGDPTEDEGADKGAQDGGSGDPAGLDGAEVPLVVTRAAAVPITKRS